MEVVAVIDFETTGMAPERGDRATEIGVVLVQDGQVVDRYQSLMNAGVRVPYFIEQLTGISDAMLRQAPPAAQVMAEAADFVGDHPLVAHNAAFDRKFWDAELARVGRQRQQQQEFACSMLLARRVFPKAPSHKLSVLVDYAKLPVAGRYHRALADAEMAASLLVRIDEELCQRYALSGVSHELLRRLPSVPRTQMERCLQNFLS